MITDIVENEEYKNLVCKQARETIDFLLDNNEEFSITANIDGITFTPNYQVVLRNSYQNSHCLF